MKKFIKNNLKVVIAFVLGAIIFGGIGVYAANIAASSVDYTKNSQSTVDGALDELFTRANTWINPSSLDFQYNSTKRILATRFGVCINRNNTFNCFKWNNWNEEKNHIQQVFSDTSCYVTSSDILTDVDCNDSDFECIIDSGGYVGCRDHSDSSRCTVNGAGSVFCN